MMNITQPPPETAPANPAPPAATPPPGPPTPPPGDRPAAPLPLINRHRTVFEQARGHIEKLLGKSPTEDELMRLWLATVTPWDVTRIFESAVLEITDSDLVPSPGDDYNQTILSL